MKSFVRRNAKIIVISAATFWIIFSVLGILNCYAAARDLKDRHSQTLQSSSLLLPGTSITLGSGKSVAEQMRQGGFDGSPYMFHPQLFVVLIIQVLILGLSLLSFYAAINFELKKPRVTRS